VILTDDNPDPRSQPIKENILIAMKWLVTDARPHEGLFFHYSGHGVQSVDLRWNSVNEYDDTIYPMDFQQSGQINSKVRLPLFAWL
jgi:metacaspase-1